MEGSQEALEKLQINDFSNGTFIPDSKSIPATLHRTYKIRGVKTDLFVQIFRDRYIFGVSQIEGKIGMYLSVDTILSEVNPREVEYEVSTLLGPRSDPMPGLYARRLADDLFHLRNDFANSLPPILLGISLKKELIREPEVVGSVVSLFVEMFKELSIQS